MCCTTHDERDQASHRNGEKLELVAADDDFRCKCTYGVACRRRATGEDMRCDWCRGKTESGHTQWCNENISVIAQGPALPQSHPSLQNRA